MTEQTVFLSYSHHSTGPLWSATARAQRNARWRARCKRSTVRPARAVPRDAQSQQPTAATHAALAGHPSVKIMYRQPRLISCLRSLLRLGRRVFGAADARASNRLKQPLDLNRAPREIVRPAPPHAPHSSQSWPFANTRLSVARTRRTQSTQRRSAQARAAARPHTRSCTAGS